MVDFSQSTVANAQIHGTIAAIQNQVYGRPGFSRAVPVGIRSASSLGSSVDAGGSANTKGSYVVLGTAPNDCEAFFAMVGPVTDIARNAQTMFLDILVNSSLILDNWMFTFGAATDVPSPNNTPVLPATIRSGDTIAARTQCSVTTTGDRVVDVMVELLY